MFSTGYVQDLPDARDRLVEGNITLFGSESPPDEFHDLAEVFGIHVEQDGESCVGFSILEALYASWRAQGIVDPKLASALFIWFNSRKTHGDETNNSGTYIRMAFRQMQRLGFCSESEWPSLDGKDLQRFAVQPPRAAYRAAYDQKMTDLEYYRVKGLGQERELSWKRALSTKHPIVFGVPIERSFFDYRGDGYIPLPDINAPIVGGHAMCALGYDATGVYGPQTWRKSWGRNGWFYMTWEYIREAALDQWAVKAPQYFSETP